MADKKISELDAVLQINNDAVFPMSQDNAGEPTTFKAGITQLGAEITEGMTFSNLQTQSKKIIGAINECAQTSGNSFASLTDTDFNNLQNNQIAKYDSTSQKWKNTTIQESDVADLVSDLADKADKTDLVYEKTASGSIASFTDGGDDIPVSEYECEIVAQQASGTPTPDNPLSITWFSQADISVCGINLWDEDWEVGRIDGISGNNYPSSDRIRSKNYIPVKPNTTYHIAMATDGLWVYWYDINKGYSTRSNYSFGSTFTTPSNCYYIRFEVYSTYGATYNNNISINYPSSDTQYHAYTGNLYTVAFGQTIYGGRLIYKDGQWSIEATFAIADFSNLTKNDPADPNNWVYYSLQSGVDEAKMSDIMCSHFPKGGLGTAGTYTYIGKVIYFNLSGVISTNNLATAKAFFTDNDVQMLIPLATPTTIPITSATRVKTISGVNNIFSNTGDNSVKYFTENADSLAELIKASESESTGDYHEYSTDEQVIGTWIDGNTLYEKTVVVTNKTSQPSDWAEVVTLSDVDKVAHVEGWFTISTVDYFEGYYVRFMFDHSTNKLKYYCQDMANTNGDITVIIRYTKSTSNTRSLNLSKGVEETEEKTEEIKTEEVKEEEK